MCVPSRVHLPPYRFYTSPPLGNYSFDHFTGYSPPIAVEATGLGVSNEAPIILAMQVVNNQRNLQIPIDDLAKGFDIKLKWTATDAAPTPAAAAAAAAATAAAAAAALLKGLL